MSRDLVERALCATLTQHETGEVRGSDCVDVAGTLSVLRTELNRLRGILNAPEVEEFFVAVESETRHQRARGRDETDADKQPEDWLWTLSYLATKALMSRRYGDRHKYLHHIITAAALCANWHRYAAADRFQK